MAHDLGRDTKELWPGLPVYSALLDKPKVKFVDQRRGLEDVALSFATKQVFGDSVKLIVDNRY